MRCDVPTNIKSMSFRWLSAPAALVALVALGGAAAIGCESTPVAKSPLDPGSTSTESGPPVEPGAESAIPTAGANPGDVPPPAPVAPDQPAAPTMSPQALADYEQGFAAFNNANISGAVQAFTSATKVDPRAYKAFFALGAMHERAGNVSGALSAYQQSFVIQPDFSAGIVAYALLQAETGNLGAAETILVQKRSALTKSAALAAALAEVKSQSKDSASAQQLAQESLKLDPTFAPAMLAVARDHYRARRLDLSLYALKAILDGFGPLNPPRDKSNAEARLLRATIWLEQDRRVMAMDEYKVVLEARPDLVVPRLRYATYLLESGGVGDAIPILQKALQYDSNNVAAHLSLGDAYRLKGDYTKARQEFDWVQRQNPGLAAAREISKVPVVGIAEASMLMACTVAHSFSIVTIRLADESRTRCPRGCIRCCCGPSASASAAGEWRSHATCRCRNDHWRRLTYEDCLQSIRSDSLSPCVHARSRRVSVGAE